MEVEVEDVVVLWCGDGGGGNNVLNAKTKPVKGRKVGLKISYKE